MSIVDTVFNIYNYILHFFSFSVVFHFPKAEYYTSYLCNNFGLREDYARLALSLVLSYPFAFIQSIIRNPTVRKVVSLLVGIAILQFCFAEGWIHCFISATVTYLIIRFCNPKRQPVYVFFFSFLYLSGMSIYTMVTDYMSYALDATTYQMIVTAKLQMLAWAVYDGTYDRENVDKGATQPDRMSRVYRRRQKEYIDEVPGLLDYYSYVFHFTGLLGGPAIYYREFMDVIGGKRYKESLPRSRLIPCLLKCLYGVIGFALYFATLQVATVDELLSDAFSYYSLPRKLLYLYIAMVGYRCRYYGVWKIGESICILDGFGETEEGNWDGVSNVDIPHFELASNYPSTIKLWNMRVQKWLQLCIYERSHFNHFITFTISAFWHGFYPSYYCGFGVALLMTYVNQLSSRKLWPRVKDTWMEKPYLYCGTVMCSLTNTFMLSAFSCYSLSRSLHMWKQVDYIHPITLFLGLLILSLVPDPVPKSKKVD